MLSKTFQALSDPSRQKILELLKKKDMAVSEIAKSFDFTLPTLSHHLNVLKQAELVTAERHGQEIIYSLNLSVFEEVSKLLIKFFSYKNLKNK
ncbi:MAG: autorepressor SdpR family transcription factor [Patescibacteria group bacterium]|nr:autorepressor SdpR family transcription factor [Patescibacteria group bacterium]MDD4611037.1 autorepressor SdpR family transcription factor [Patescibacteria group bacterium]